MSQVDLQVMDLQVTEDPQVMEDLHCEYGLQLNHVHKKVLLTEGTTFELNDRGLIYTDSKTQVYIISENYLTSYFTNQEI